MTGPARKSGVGAFALGRLTGAFGGAWRALGGTALGAAVRRMLVAPARNLDLLAAWIVALVAQPLVPLDHPLGRADLVPWITACVVLAALLRGRSLGDPPHPSLTPRRDPRAAWAERVALGLAPVAVMLWFDAATALGRNVLRPDEHFWLLWGALALSVATLGLAAWGRADQRTAWSVPRGWGWSHVAVRVLGVVGLAWALGLTYALVESATAAAMCVAMLLGLEFLAVAWLPDRIQNLWQRREAGLRDGGPYRTPIFRFVLASVGPGVGLGLLLVAQHALLGRMSFEQAPAVALYVFAWAVVIWPPSIPVAVSCVLHEVVPASGRDPAAKGLASFDAPPTGALRLDPLGIKRIRLLHHWVVPVQDARIEELDDPIRTLWPRRGTPLAFHVLGDAAFEPDDETQLPQWHTITVRLTGQQDVGRLREETVQTRRLVVLRPFPSRGRRVPRALRTYRWQADTPQGTVQVVDATTDHLTLQDGDIIVLSVEGVARAFELEIGTLIHDWAELGNLRPPQLEDYVGVS